MISFWTLVHRELKRNFRVWTQTFLPPVISALLYIAVFGKFIGDRIGEVAGMSYIEFLIPGLVMMNLITSTYGGASFTVFFAKWENTMNDLLTSPMSYTQIVCAILLGGGIIRGVLTAIVVLIPLMFFGSASLVHPLATLFFAVVTSLLFAAFGMMAGLWAERFDHFNIIQTFIISPLIYLGGVFYSIETLPEGVQHASQFNPMLYMVDGFRYGMTGVSDIAPGTSAAVVSVLAATALISCIRLFQKGYKLRT